MITNSELPYSVFQDGVGDRLIVQERLAFAVRPAARRKFTVVIFQKNKTALGPGQFQGHVQQGDKYLVQHAGGIQLAGGFQKKCELFQVVGLGGNLDVREI